MTANSGANVQQKEQSLLSQCSANNKKKGEKTHPCPFVHREHSVQTNSAAKPKGHTGGREEKLGKPH